MPARRYGGGGRIDFREILQGLGFDKAEFNDDFGKEPGEVDYTYKGDPSQKVSEPYNTPSFLQTMAGNPAKQLNSSWQLASMRSDQNFERQVQMARERAMVEAEQEAAKRRQAILDAQAGGLDETKAASVARGSSMGKRQGTLAQILPAFTSEQEAALALALHGEELLNRGVTGNALEQDAKTLKNEADRFSNSQMAWNELLKQRGMAEANRGKTLDNDKLEAGRHWWGTEKLGDSILFPGGGFIGLDKTGGGSEFDFSAGGTPPPAEGALPFGFGQKRPATHAPYMGSYARGIRNPETGEFMLPKTPQAAEAFTRLFGGSYQFNAPPQQAKQPVGATGGWGDEVGVQFDKGPEPQVEPASIFKQDPAKTGKLKQDMLDIFGPNWKDWVPFGPYFKD